MAMNCADSLLHMTSLKIWYEMDSRLAMITPRRPMSMTLTRCSPPRDHRTERTIFMVLARSGYLYGRHFRWFQKALWALGNISDSILLELDLRRLHWAVASPKLYYEAPGRRSNNWSGTT